MGCPICDNKAANCDCTATEREQFDEIESLQAEIARLREENRLLIEDRARFPDKPDGIGRIIAAHNANREAKITDLENRCRIDQSEIGRLRGERRWVPVGERLPDKSERVLLFDPTIPDFPRTNTHVVIGYFRGLDDWISPWHCPDGRGPTHWLPLPPGPEGEA
jgi:hypothetical protein